MSPDERFPRVFAFYSISSRWVPVGSFPADLRFGGRLSEALRRNSAWPNWSNFVEEADHLHSWTSFRAPWLTDWFLACCIIIQRAKMKNLLLYIILGAPGLHLPFCFKFGKLLGWSSSKNVDWFLLCFTGKPSKFVLMCLLYSLRLFMHECKRGYTSLLIVIYMFELPFKHSPKHKTHEVFS